MTVKSQNKCSYFETKKELRFFATVAAVLVKRFDVSPQTEFVQEVHAGTSDDPLSAYH